MSAIDTSVGPQATVVTVSPQPSLVSDLITSNTPLASPQSAASNPYPDPNAVPPTQNNAGVAPSKLTIGATGNVISAACPTIVFANPS
jgi:hypothetical protein